MESDIESRIQRAVEALLENEAITSNLDDIQADKFLKWAQARTQAIIKDTAGMDDLTAEETSYPRQKALRRFARYLNRAAAGDGDLFSTVQQLFEQAQLIYNKNEISIPEDQVNTLAMVVQIEPLVVLEFISNLFEGEGEYGKEEI